MVERRFPQPATVVLVTMDVEHLSSQTRTAFFDGDSLRPSTLAYRTAADQKDALSADDVHIPLLWGINADANR